MFFLYSGCREREVMLRAGTTLISSTEPTRSGLNLTWASALGIPDDGDHRFRAMAMSVINCIDSVAPPSHYGKVVSYVFR
jgi:hypothetical protein